jgi:hypothetical protein
LKKFFKILLFTLAPLLVSGSEIYADSLPLSYSGRITDATGKPFSGKVDLEINFYSKASKGSSLIGAKEFAGIKLSNGTFQIDIELSAAESATMFGNGDKVVYIQVTDLTRDTVLPRQKFNAVPYALKVPVDGSTIYFNNDGKLTVEGASAGSGPSDSDALSEGSTNLYFTDARSKAASVADSISDGTTDVAASQNAVYDALDLKADKDAAVGVGSFDNAAETTLTTGYSGTDEGKTWYNSDTNQIKYWNGSTTVVLGAAGSGLGNLNGETGATQSFGVGTSGTAPAWSSATNIHTLNIPDAADPGVTAGLISKADYDSFDGKISVESDPKIGTLTNTKWCTTDGTTIDCATNAPVDYPAGDSTKVGFLTVTGGVDLDTMDTDVTTNNSKVSYTGAADVAASKTKTDFLTVTGGVDLDTMDTDVTTNNGKVSYTGAADVAASKTKTDFLTVTGATDLDTMRSDVTANNAKATYPGADSTKLSGITAGAEVNAAQVSGAEITAGNETEERSWSPQDVQDMVDTHAGTPAPAGVDSQIQYNNGGSTGASLDFIWDDTENALGIGTATPSGKLQIYGTSTTDIITSFSEKRFTTGSTGTTNGVGLQGKASDAVASTFTNTGYISGVKAEAFSSGPGNIAVVNGLEAQSVNSSSGNITDAFGVDISSANTSTGTITNAYGLRSVPLNLNISGTITNAYGLHTSVDRTAGTITNGYGLYIADVEASNDYGIYQDTADDDNYFAGNVGIGSINPMATLDVNGTVMIQGGSPGAGKVLTSSDATGVATWEAVPASGSGSDFTSTSSAAGTVAMTVKGAGSQTANLLEVQNSGSTVLTVIDENGHIGIGVSDPQSALHISDPTDITPSDSGAAHIEILGNGYTGYIALDATAMYMGHNSASRNLSFQTNETTRMTLNASGNVGIGTTSPSTILHLKNSTNPEMRIQDSDETSYLSMQPVGSSNGNIKWVKPTGASTLDIDAVAQDTTSASLIQMFRNTTTSGTKSFQLMNGDGSATVDSQIGVDGSNTFFNTGNVGIGTTTPLTQLHISTGAGSDTIRVSGQHTIGADIGAIEFGTVLGGVEDDTSGIRGVQMGGDNSNKALDLFTSNSTEETVTRMRIDQTGNVGIGTVTPNQLLTLEGTMSLKEQAAANADTAAYGQVWVKTATPNELWFTDDAGSDFQLGAAGGSSTFDGVGTGTNTTAAMVVSTGASLTKSGSGIIEATRFLGSDSTTTAVDLATSEVSGALPASKGGTGQTTLTANAVLVGNGTSGVSSVAPSTSGNVLTSNGTTWASTAPMTPTYATVYKDAEQTIAGTNTWYDVTFNQELTKSGDITHSTGSNTDDIEVEATGTYRISYSLNCELTVSNIASCFTRLTDTDGASEIPGSFRTATINAQNYSQTLSATVIVDLSANEHVTLQFGSQNSGMVIGSYTSSGPSGTMAPATLSIERID